MADSNELMAKIGLKFKDATLLETALTHRSFINEHRRSKLQHNERLEFLGDAVLELVVTHHLYQNYGEPEGVLTNWRSALVNTSSLSGVGAKLGLFEFVRLSRGEARGSERARRQILANTMEAIIGALYLDQGYDAAKQFILDKIVVNLEEIIKSGSWQDAKTKYQELTQEKEGFTPEYKVLGEDGPDHDKQFSVGVYVNRQLRGQGTGSSKQNAQQSAAADALAKIQEKSVDTPQ
jgi:ribonuclease III